VSAIHVLTYQNLLFVIEEKCWIDINFATQLRAKESIKGAASAYN